MDICAFLEMSRDDLRRSTDQLDELQLSMLAARIRDLLGILVARGQHDQLCRLADSAVAAVDVCERFFNLKPTL